MRKGFVVAALFAAMLALAPMSLAQPAGGGGGAGGGRGGRGGAGGGAGGAGGRFGQIGGAMMGARDTFTISMTVLSELNLTPDFTLAKEQKEKIQGIKDEEKKAADKWTADHKDDFTALMSANQADRQQKMQDLQADRAKVLDPFTAQLKAVLTEDQAKAFNTKLEERQKEMDAARAARGAGGRGGNGGAPAPGGNAGPGGQL